MGRAKVANISGIVQARGLGSISLSEYDELIERLDTFQDIFDLARDISPAWHRKMERLWLSEQKLKQRFPLRGNDEAFYFKPTQDSKIAVAVHMLSKQPAPVLDWLEPYELLAAGAGDFAPVNFDLSAVTRAAEQARDAAVQKGVWGEADIDIAEEALSLYPDEKNTVKKDARDLAPVAALLYVSSQIRAWLELLYGRCNS